MQQRIDFTKVSPAAYKAVAALQTYVDQSGLEPKLRELIKIRASQINSCADCIAMRTRDARKHARGGSDQHLEPHRDFVARAAAGREHKSRGLTLSFPPFSGHACAPGWRSVFKVSNDCD